MSSKSPLRAIKSKDQRQSGIHPVLSESCEDLAPEQRLWAAVIMLAVRDVQGGDMMSKAWFRSTDFEDVADFAGVSPVEVRRLLADRVG